MVLGHFDAAQASLDTIKKKKMPRTNSVDARMVLHLCPVKVVDIANLCG